jgi:hypothetical protein
MKARTCCTAADVSRNQAFRPASYWRRWAGVAGWIVPGFTIILLPKCPMCIAMYVALFTGVGISMKTASWLRGGLLLLSVMILGGLALRTPYPCRLLRSCFGRSRLFARRDCRSVRSGGALSTESGDNPPGAIRRRALLLPFRRVSG